jgi:predicted DNA-binding protein (UPF0251 family)
MKVWLTKNGYFIPGYPFKIVFTDREADVLYLHGYHGASFAEIGALMGGVSKQAVHQAFLRAQLKIRRFRQTQSQGEKAAPTERAVA